MTHDDEVLAWDRHKNVADNWISNIHDHDTISSNKIETNIYTDKAKRCYENLYLLIIIQC